MSEAEVQARETRTDGHTDAYPHSGRLETRNEVRIALALFHQVLQNLQMAATRSTEGKEDETQQGKSDEFHSTINESF